MAITFPSDYKEQIDEIRDVIGQTVTFYLEGTPTVCPVCSGAGYYDPVNETSTDWACFLCSGAYYLYNDDTESIKAHVRWKSSDIPEFTTAGFYPQGTCTVTIDINDLADNQISLIKYIVADNRKLQVNEVVKRGVPTRNRIRFVCKEYEKT